MRKYILSVLLLALIAPVNVVAQDDLYFTPTKKSVEEGKKARRAIKQAEDAGTYGTYYSGINKTDDEYNRRNKRDGFTPYKINEETLYSPDSIASDVIEFSVGEDMVADSFRVDTVYKYVILDDDDYQYSRRLSRFDDFYWWRGYYGPSYWSRPIGWYTGWYGPWYDPWYAGWYDPWYTGWYDPWYAGWYDPWYDPWYYGYYPGWWAGGPLWGCYPGWHGHHHIIVGGKPSGGGSTHAFAGTSNHRYSRSTGGNSYDIANRNGDRITGHRGTGYRRNSSRTDNYRYNNSYNSYRQPNYSASPTYSTPSYSTGGHAGGSRGGHTGGVSGGSRSGGSFGGGRR